MKSALIHDLTSRLDTLEENVNNIQQQVKDQISVHECVAMCKSVEEKLLYRVDRECGRVRKHLEVLIQDLGQSMVDCLKRRDKHF